MKFGFVFLMFFVSIFPCFAETQLISPIEYSAQVSQLTLEEATSSKFRKLLDIAIDQIDYQINSSLKLNEKISREIAASTNLVTVLFRKYLSLHGAQFGKQLIITTLDPEYHNLLNQSSYIIDTKQKSKRENVISFIGTLLRLPFSNS